MNDLVLLAALLRGPAYGYALKQTAGLIFGNDAIHNNIIYPALRKFMESRWVAQSNVEGERGQQRKQYRITPAGRKHLVDRLKTFDAGDAADESAFLFRVALFDLLPGKCRDAILESRQSYLTGRAEKLRELRDATEPASFGAVALDRVIARIRDELRWIRDVERKVKGE